MVCTQTQLSCNCLYCLWSKTTTEMRMQWRPTTIWTVCNTLTAMIYFVSNKYIIDVRKGNPYSIIVRAIRVSRVRLRAIADLAHRNLMKTLTTTESGPSPDIGFQLETLLNPDACVIQIPFTTKESIIPSAALYLNELNVIPYRNKIVPEEVFMSRLRKCARGSITNRDVSSLFPHHNISGSVFNLLVGWWVGKSFFLRCFILFELIWSFYFEIHIIGLMLR